MIYLVGAGGHGKVVLEAFLLAGCEVVVLDADPARVGGELLGRPVAREEAAFAALEEPVDFFVGIGDGASRRRVTERWETKGHRLVRAVHPAAQASRWSSLSPGAAVMAGAVIQPGAAVARGAIINTGASVDHDCRIGEFAHLAPGARLAGSVEVGEGAWIGIRAAVREGTVIGARCVVGAGSVVVDDLPPDIVAFGNPCRVVRQIGRHD